VLCSLVLPCDDSTRLIKAKFHYASWFEAGSKLVADRFEAGRRPASNQLRTSFEPVLAGLQNFTSTWTYWTIKIALQCARSVQCILWFRQSSHSARLSELWLQYTFVTRSVLFSYTADVMISVPVLSDAPSHPLLLSFQLHVQHCSVRFRGTVDHTSHYHKRRIRTKLDESAYSHSGPAASLLSQELWTVFLPQIQYTFPHRFCFVILLVISSLYVQYSELHCMSLCL